MKVGFDNEKYLKMQSAHIEERINKFGDKLYLEFGGKLFDDYHASRVLPGFEPDSKLRMLMKLSDRAEIVIVINSADIEKNKVRGDLGITYDEDVRRLMNEFESRGLYVGSVVLTHYAGQAGAVSFKEKLEKKHVKVYLHYTIEGYPSNIPLIVSDEGYGRNEYIETTRPLVVVTAPGPGSGKMATCLSQLYHDNKRGIKAGYAKYETFPIWNIPLKHPVNLAYEAATADLNDINMIDPFHLEAYGETTVNYNRDIEIFPVLNAIFEGIYGENRYLKSYWMIQEELPMGIKECRIRQKQVLQREKRCREKLSEPVDYEQRDQVYREMLKLLKLSFSHKADLRRRGLTEAEISRMEQLGYRSICAEDSVSIARRLIRSGCNLKGVPGFFVNRNHDWEIAFYPKNSGYLCPVWSFDGLLTAFQIRLDVPYQKRKYVWLSSAKLDKGCSPGSPVSLSGDPDGQRVFVTEGILKAEITHQRTGETYIGNHGVANHKELRQMPVKNFP